MTGQPTNRSNSQLDLVVFAPYYPPHTGGLETHAQDFNRHLIGQVNSITVLTTRLPADAPLEEQDGRISIRRFPAIELVPNYPIPKFWSPTFWRLWLQIYQQPANLVLSRTRFFSTSLVALVYAKTRRLRWIHIEHGSDYPQLNSRFKSLVGRLYDQTLGRLVFRTSGQNIAISQAAAEFIGWFDQRATPVIYRGVQTAKILAAAPDKQVRQKYKDRIIVTFLGRLIDGKGVQDLLAALAQLQNPRVICFVIGDGPMRSSLETQAKQLGAESVFWGNQDLESAIGLLKISDIFVNPSYTEGLPTSVIEAALCQVAIVATDVGGTREIIEQQVSGLLVSPRDIDSLKTALTQLIEQPPLRKKLATQASLVAQERFNWDRSIEQYLKVFADSAN